MKHTLRKVNAWWWQAAAHRPLLMCLLGGALMALAFPPFPVPLLAVLGWLPLWAALETNVAHRPGRPALRRWGRWWRTFAYAYVFFLTWQLGVNYWLFYTGWNLDDPAMRVAGFISGLAANVANPVVMSLPVLGWLFVRRRLGFRWGWAAFVPLYEGFEEFHFNWDLTWSWTTLGNAFATWPGYVQYIEFTGVLGASAFALGLGLGLLAMGQRARTGQAVPVRLWGAWLGAAVLPLLLWPALTYPGRGCYQPAGYLNTRVVQPNIDPYEEKFGGMTGAQQVQELMRLSTQPGPAFVPDSLHLVVMPETGVPGRILEHEIDHYPLLQPLIAATQRYPRMHLLAGIISVKLYPEGVVPQSASARCGPGLPCFDVYNAAAFVGPQQPTQVYRKSRLVPFSERPPFMGFFKLLKNWNLDLGGGLGAFGIPDTLNIVHMRTGTGVGPIICYESIFPGYVRQVVQAGAGVLCIITNDGWWKDTHGYRQHAAFARLRAIETRRAIARAANTGQSCFVSATGELTQPTAWWQEAIIEERLPVLTGHTLYVRLGDWLGNLCLWGSLALLPVVGIGARWRRRLRASLG